MHLGNTGLLNGRTRAYGKPMPHGAYDYVSLGVRLGIWRRMATQYTVVVSSVFQGAQRIPKELRAMHYHESPSLLFVLPLSRCLPT